jgi:hypothetical protein
MAKDAAYAKAPNKRKARGTDPRFAAFARLLARHAVRKELEKDSGVSHDSTVPAKDAS